MPRLSAPEITKEIRSAGADDLVFPMHPNADDPNNLRQRCEQANEILVKSGWPNEPVRPKIKDLLAAAHERDKQRNIARQKD